MTPLPVMIRRLDRLPVKHRIAFLKSMLKVERPYTMRRTIMEDLLQVEVLKQLRKEIRAA